MDSTIARNGRSHYSSKHKSSKTTGTNNNNNNAHYQQHKSQRHLIPRFSKNISQNQSQRSINGSGGGSSSGGASDGQEIQRKNSGNVDDSHRRFKAPFLTKISAKTIKGSNDVSSLMKDLALAGKTKRCDKIDDNDDDGNRRRRFLGAFQLQSPNDPPTNEGDVSNTSSSSSSCGEYPTQLVSWIKYANEVCGRDMREVVKGIFDEVGDAELESIFEALVAFYSLKQNAAEAVIDYAAKKKRAFEAYRGAKNSHKETNSDSSSSATSDYALMDLDDEDEFPPLIKATPGGSGGVRGGSCGPLDTLQLTKTAISTTTFATITEAARPDDNKRSSSPADSAVVIVDSLTEKENEELCLSFAQGLHREETRSSLIYRRTMVSKESWEDTVDEAVRVDGEMKNKREIEEDKDALLSVSDKDETLLWMSKLPTIEDFGAHAETFISLNNNPFSFASMNFGKALDFEDPNVGRGMATVVSDASSKGSTSTMEESASSPSDVKEKPDVDPRCHGIAERISGRPSPPHSPFSPMNSAAESAIIASSERNRLAGSPLQQRQQHPRLSQNFPPHAQLHHPRHYPQRFDGFYGWHDAHHSSVPPYHLHFPYAQRKPPFQHHAHLQQHHHLYRHQLVQWPQPHKLHRQPPRSGKPDVDSPTYMLQQQQKLVAAAAVAAGTSCQRCGKTGHVAPSCPDALPKGDALHSDKQCFHCYQFGHLAKACPIARDNYFYLRMGGT